MLFNNKREHVIIGFEHSNIVFIRNNDQWDFDVLTRLNNDTDDVPSKSNALNILADKTKRELLNPLRKNLWRKPSITLVCSNALLHEEALVLYRFCQLIGGIDNTLVQVASVVAFMKRPHYSLIITHYMLLDEEKPYRIQEKIFTRSEA